MRYLFFIIFLYFFSTSIYAAGCEKTCGIDALPKYCIIDCKIDESANCYCKENGTAVCECLPFNRIDPGDD